MSSSPATSPPLLDIEIVTLFPEIFDSFLTVSLLGKAIEKGIVRVSRTNPREFAPGHQRKVDDAPYGGGPGMIMMPGPLATAIESVEGERGPAHRILLAPSGRPFDQYLAETLARRGRLLLICGRYEGIDERIVDLFLPEVVSVGDCVLSGGEMAAAVIIEATARLVPGVLGCEESTRDESFAAGRLEYPQWTRPASFRGREVPEESCSRAIMPRWRPGGSGNPSGAPWPAGPT